MISPVVLFTLTVAFGDSAGAPATLGNRASQASGAQTRPPGSQAEAISPDVVQIDGKLEPERIPEYVLWRDAFYLIAFLKRERESEGEGTPWTLPMIQGADGTVTPLQLSARDADVLEAEATRQKERDVACDVELRRVIGKLAEENKKPDEIAQALVEPIIACRWKDLEARDRVLERISEEGAAAVRAWVNGRRYTTTLSVTRRELPYLMLPQ